MRKLIYYVATTADGFIATKSGGFDVYLQDGPHMADMLADYPETLPAVARTQLGIATEPNRVFDTVLMGRATYEVGARQGVVNPYPHLEQYVFSSTLPASRDPAVKLVHGEAKPFVRQLKERPGRAIWLCGGGQLAAELFDEIDELVLKQNPVVIGAGIPLFAREVPATRMTLLERRQYDNGYLRLHYALQR